MRERAIPPDDIPAEEFFLRWLPATVASDPDRRARLGATRADLVFELLGEGGGLYTVHLDAGSVQGRLGGVVKPDLHIQVDVETWRKLNRGEISAPEAALRRRVKLSGNLMLAVKLHLILG